MLVLRASLVRSRSRLCSTSQLWAEKRCGQLCSNTLRLITTAPEGTVLWAISVQKSLNQNMSLRSVSILAGTDHSSK